MRRHQWSIRPLEVVAEGVSPGEREQYWIERLRDEGERLFNVWPKRKDRCGCCRMTATPEVIDFCLSVGGVCLTGKTGQVKPCDQFGCPTKDEA